MFTTRAIALATPIAIAIGCGALSLACGEESARFETGCDTELVLGQTFSLPQNPGDRSFQGHASFDGRAIWLTHAQAPADEETIVVSALRVHCNGTEASASTRLAEQSGIQTEPRVTSSQGQVLIAWQHDDQVSSANLSVHYLHFDREAGPAGAQIRHLDTQYKGSSAANTWFPELSASKAGFAVAGLRGVSDYDSFQTFVQRIDRDGNMVGASIDGNLQDERSQSAPSALLGDDNSLTLAWSETDVDGNNQVLHVHIDADAEQPVGAPILASRQGGSMSSQGGNESEGQFMAFITEDGAVAVKPSELFNAEAPVLHVREPGGGPLAPKIAVGPTGGAVAWIEPLTGFNGEIHLQGFVGDGFDMERAGSAMRITTDAPAIIPYGIDIEHIEDSVYMITWTEGPTSDLQIKWQMVDFAPT